MTAGSTSVSPMYQLAQINHANSSPALTSPSSRSPRTLTPMPTTTSSHPVSSRISEIPTYSVLAQESGDRRWCRVVMMFFIVNVLATSAMLAVGVWRLKEVEAMKINYTSGNIQVNIDTTSPDIPDKQLSCRTPAIRHSLNFSNPYISIDNTCKHEMNYQIVAGWHSTLADISSTTEITYNPSESCFRVQSVGNYVVYNQLTFGCPLSADTSKQSASIINSCQVKIMYSQGIFVKDGHNREQNFELHDTWQGVQPVESESDKICHTSRLFGMVTLLPGNHVCVKATPHCLLRGRPGQTFFGMYRV